ncbi:MAG: hypothetical protein ACLPKI_09790 [Streptosporangiaceae bacterium]
MSEPVSRPVTEATAARAVSTSRSAWRAGPGSAWPAGVSGTPRATL